MRYIIMAFLLLLYACEENSEPLTDITISTRFYGSTNYYVYAYSFELNEKVKTLSTENKVPDIIPENVLIPSGEVIGAQFSTSRNNPYGFYLNAEFESMEEAAFFYNDYKDAVTGPWQMLSDTLAPYQVYTMRTYKDNYVKFLIKDIRINKNGQLSDYVEIDLEYFIQRNGTTVFDE